jgi:hypothetical protein
VRRRLLLIALGVLVALAAISQFALPAIAESQIEKRLTEGGGEADANLSAFPAVRLLWQEGGSLEVEGSDLQLEDERFEVNKLNGFEDVDVSLAESTVGPLDVSTFALSRVGDKPYSVTGEMSTDGARFADAIADGFGVPGGEAVEFALGLTDLGSRGISITLDVEMEIDEDGRVQVTEDRSEVAGLPTGPWSKLITAAIVVRL